MSQVPGVPGDPAEGRRGLRWLALVGLLALNSAAALTAVSVVGALAFPGSREEIVRNAEASWPPDGATNPVALVVETGREMAWIAASVVREAWQMDSIPLAVLGTIYLVLVVAPVAMVAPIVGPPGLVEGGRSLRTSAIAAGIVSGSVCAGLLGCLGDLAWLALTSGSPNQTVSLIGLLVAWLVMGTVAAVLLAHAGRERNPAHLVRFVRWLLAGTVVELALAVPTLAAANRRDNCACGWSSFWALSAGLVTLGALCGPALVLLLTRDARRHWARSACMRCGYPRRTDTAMCSECGAPLPPAAIRASDGDARPA